MSRSLVILTDKCVDHLVYWMLSVLIICYIECWVCWSLVILNVECADSLVILNVECADDMILLDPSQTYCHHISYILCSAFHYHIMNIISAWVMKDSRFFSYLQDQIFVARLSLQNNWWIHIQCVKEKRKCTKKPSSNPQGITHLLISQHPCPPPPKKYLKKY